MFWSKYQFRSICFAILNYIVRFIQFALDTVVKPNKRMELMSVDRPFHISQAVLNVPRNELANNQVWIKCNDKMSLIANLNNAITQVRLDLAFGSGDVIMFFNKSDETGADVHLSGYYLQVDDGDIQQNLSVASKDNQSFCDESNDQKIQTQSASRVSGIGFEASNTREQAQQSFMNSNEMSVCKCLC